MNHHSQKNKQFLPRSDESLSLCTMIFPFGRFSINFWMTVGKQMMFIFYSILKCHSCNMSYNSPKKRNNHFIVAAFLRITCWCFFILKYLFIQLTTAFFFRDHRNIIQLSSLVIMLYAKLDAACAKRLRVERHHSRRSLFKICVEL